VAAGFDCAFLGRFVPFSELTQWYDGISNERSMEVASFSDDISPMNHQSDLAPAQQQLDLTKAYRTSTYYLGNMSGNFRSQPLPAKFMALHQSERRYGTRRVA
jgi:hypothetical protein